MTEAYCIMCRRMVPARRGLGRGIFLLADHYRFNFRKGGDTYPCPGRVTASPVTHGMEDPKAAYRSAPRWWGRVGPSLPRRGYSEYVD